MAKQIFFRAHSRAFAAKERCLNRIKRFPGLNDWGGPTYGEINKIPPFDRLKQGSLGKLYLDAKVWLQKDEQKK